MAAQGPSLQGDELAEILARLPARSIGRCRAVCRAWNAIASHPSVDRVLAKRPAAVITIVKNPMWLEVEDERRRPGDVVQVDRFRGRWHPDVHRTEPSPRAIHLDDMTLSPVDFSSWDGVLCTRAFPRKPQQLLAGTGYMLWNPLTDACAVVSAPAGQGRLIGGYTHPVTGRFHLVHSSDVPVPGDRDDMVAPVTVRILGVGDDGAGWREVPLPPLSAMTMRGERDHSVSLHGNLHWLVRSGGSAENKAAAALLVFDPARERFRLMAAPERPELDLTTARSRVAAGGKLCILGLTKQPPVALEVWVLDDYSDPRSWRLRATARLAGTGVSPAMFAAATAVEVVAGVNEGEEVFVQVEHGISAYSLRSKVWRRVSVGRRCCAALLMYRESAMLPEVSFGEALRGFNRGTASPGQCYNDGWSGRCTYNSADLPLDWSVIKRGFKS